MVILLLSEDIEKNLQMIEHSGFVNAIFVEDIFMYQERAYAQETLNPADA